MNGLSVNPELVRQLSSYLNDKAVKYDGRLEELYNKFNNLSNYWSGKDYDAANSVMQQNKAPLLELGQILHQLCNALNMAADEYERKIRASAAQFE